MLTVDFKKRTDNSGINLIIVGGTLTEKSFLGIPYDSLYAATSLKEAKDWLGSGDIGACCRGTQETAGGYHWKYAEKIN